MAASAQDRVEAVLERTAGFYRAYLRDAAEVSVMRGWLTTAVGDRLLDEFGVGYAPAGWSVLREHLQAEGFGDAELHAAGVIHRSHRSEQLYDHFRSRIIFPVRERGGRLLGFAGLATAPGPSWPQWLTSPDGERYRRSSAIFAIDRAADAIEAAGRAVVYRDCLEVLRRHGAGEREAVAIVRSNVTAAHRAQLGELAPRIERGRPLSGRRGAGRGP